MSRRFAVFIAVLLMVAGLAALSGSTAHGQEAQKNGKSDGITVYLSVSFDSSFKIGTNEEIGRASCRERV